MSRLVAVGGEDRVSVGDRADSREQFSRWRVFEQESAGAGFEPGKDVLVQIEGGEDTDLVGRAAVIETLAWPSRCSGEAAEWSVAGIGQAVHGTPGSCRRG
jgi:hypothetical protein